MTRTRILATAALALLAASCSDPTGTGTVTQFGSNTIGSGGSVAPPSGPSFDGGNTMGSGTSLGGTSVDSTSTASSPEVGTADERGPNTLGSGN